MHKRIKGNKLAIGAALAIAGAGATGAAQAQSASDAQIQALQAKIEQLQRQNQQQINELQRQVKQLSGAQVKATADAQAARDQAAHEAVHFARGGTIVWGGNPGA